MDAAETILDAEHRQLPMPDSPALAQALLAANVQTLLMVYVHLTHDEAMLDQFKFYIRPPFANPATEIPPEYLEELREKLRVVLTTPGAARSDAPPSALIVKMMNVGTGEPVDDEFVPMTLEQNGFAVPTPRRDQPDYSAPPAGFKVLVIGAALPACSPVSSWKKPALTT
jgi:4-hydroxyacetophenone monooxygenase